MCAFNLKQFNTLLTSQSQKCILLHIYIFLIYNQHIDRIAMAVMSDNTLLSSTKINGYDF